MTSWARRSRFAGSKDRAAVRDHVYHSIRNLSSFQSIAGQTSCGASGRSLMIGACVAQEIPLDTVFTGERHAPHPLTDEERAAITAPPSDDPDMPAWIFESLSNAMGHDVALQQARALSHRGPITLRTNLQKTTRPALMDRLTRAGVDLRENPLAEAALTLVQDRGGLTNLPEFQEGLFEMQDASSQAVVEALDLSRSDHILDFCAGGGGKTLALAARSGKVVTAHDIDAGRMKDLPQRAERAGAQVRIMRDRAHLKPAGFDIILIDAPCSGSGSWRRAPDAKWRLTRERLAELQAIQRDVLMQTVPLASAQGRICYATCSILAEENEVQKDWFLANFDGWAVHQEHHWTVTPDGDGFYLVQFMRENAFD
ncbi:RsmB/NOP family class I SAM-dependent RNA methyltransferase [Aliishimia ponticola]|uniref:RsmB/NOP family class I SAM-dependent RNA methyltransferase n=1 Tax=Aliishimia ponticola TaxID=2499833 RepID=UPI001FE2B682|nr:RsmB/NOP family class I SAM-dependent RNA methyltransferase [Aliishimia ponticola]